MNWQTIHAALREARWLTPDRVRAYAVIVLGIELLALLILAGRTYGLFLPIDPPTSLDYMSFYAAGTLADRGTPEGAYDETIHGKTEKQIYGDERIAYFGFYYPPVFQLLCAALAALPFTISYLLFVGLSGAAFFATLRATAGNGRLTLALLSFPAAFLTVALGQNSFLTTALFGAALLILDRQPILAGMMFGALCYKPHFLLMVPIALLAGRYWRTIVSAAATSAALIGASVLIFGWHIWQDFFNTTLLAQSVFETGRVGFWHLISVFGAVRLAGGGANLAYIIQFTVTGAAAICSGWVWYRISDLAVRAATLISATLVSLPVILFYDLLPATIAMAWLMRDARRGGYLPWEKSIYCALWPIALLCRGIGEKTHVPTGWLLTFALLALAMLHAWRELEAAPAKPEQNSAPEQIREKA